MSWQIGATKKGGLRVEIDKRKWGKVVIRRHVFVHPPTLARARALAIAHAHARTCRW